MLLARHEKENGRKIKENEKVIDGFNSASGCTAEVDQLVVLPMEQLESSFEFFLHYHYHLHRHDEGCAIYTPTYVKGALLLFI